MPDRPTPSPASRDAATRHNAPRPFQVYNRRPRSAASPRDQARLQAPRRRRTRIGHLKEHHRMGRTSSPTAPEMPANAILAPSATTSDGSRLVQSSLRLFLECLRPTQIIQVHLKSIVPDDILGLAATLTFQATRESANRLWSVWYRGCDDQFQCPASGPAETAIAHPAAVNPTRFDRGLKIVARYPKNPCPSNAVAGSKTK